MHSSSPPPYCRKTGFVLAAIFFIAAAISLSTSIRIHYPDIGAALVRPNYLITLIMALLLLASSFIPFLFFVQPLTFLAGAVLAFSMEQVQFYGIAFFIMLIISLFRLGFYNKHKIARTIVSLVLFYGMEIASVVREGKPAVESLEPIFFITVFLLMLYLAFQEKIMVYLKEPKQKLSLTAKGLSEVETAYVKALVGGKTIKELSVDKEVAESTVRNTLARAYKKLEVPDRAGLLALGEKYEIAD